jgi:hypothetical protein
MLLVKSHKDTKSFAMHTIPTLYLPTPDLSTLIIPRPTSVRLISQRLNRLKANTLIVSKMLNILAAQMQQGYCVSG